ncbi:hypothetical protein DFJ77DRAFT_470006 [Powellomyces hirtus]|nr:hypothetical protein DFJ77DRAFT_470006 [Powellomyces hirtus]
MIALSAELVDQIVDHLWDDLVTHLDTKQYLCLALVCKAFKNVMYAKHRRKTLMLAQSAALSTIVGGTSGVSARHLIRYKDPFSNPFIPPLELLASIFDRIELDTFATYMLPLLLKHKSRIDSFLCTTERPYLWKTKGAAYVYGASLGREIRLFMRYRTCWLLKGVGTLERPEIIWEYAYISDLPCYSSVFFNLERNFEAELQHVGTLGGYFKNMKK